MATKRRQFVRVGALKDVRDPVYGYEIDWEKEAPRHHMTVAQLETVYELASDPGTPTSTVYDLTEQWMKADQFLPSAKAVRAALAANPANSLLGLMRLYREFPDIVRENPSLPMIVLESPESARILRAMSKPMWELYRQMNELFLTDGKRPPSTEVTDQIQRIMDLGYTEEDLQAFRTIISTDSTKANSLLTNMWDFWLWVSEWRAAMPVAGEPGLVIAYVIAIKDKFADLPVKGMLLPNMVYSTGNTEIRETIVTSPKGNFPIVYSHLEGAKYELPCVRKRFGVKASALAIIPVKVKLSELQPLVNLGSTTTSCDKYFSRHSHGALRVSLSPDRFVFPSTKTKRATKSKQVIGAKKKYDDASLDSKALVKLAKRQPKTYANPNLPFDVLLEAAAIYPWYVEQNPVLALLALEEPKQAEQIQEALKVGWRYSLPFNISNKHNIQFAADCAEHVLHLFEMKSPLDRRPRTAIEVARQFAEGLVTNNVLEKASDQAYAARGSVPDFAANAAAAAAEFAAKSNSESAAYFAAVASGYHGSTEGKAKEEKWQMERARYYYGLEHPEYQAPVIGRKKSRRQESLT